MRWSDYSLAAPVGSVAAGRSPTAPGTDPLLHCPAVPTQRPYRDRSESDVDRWAADARVEAAAMARTRERSLREQERETTTLVGVLVALAERGSATVIDLVGGRRTQGVVTGVGRDFCAVRHHGGHALVSLDAIVAVRPPPGERAPTGARPTSLDLTMAEALVDLAGCRTRVAVAVAGSGRAICGELASVGDDVVCVRPDHDPAGNERAGTVYVPLASVVEVSVPTSG